MFSDPTSVFMALLTVATCFGMSMGGTYYLIRKTGLWSKMQEEKYERQSANKRLIDAAEKLLGFVDTTAGNPFIKVEHARELRDAVANHVKVIQA